MRNEEQRELIDRLAEYLGKLGDEGNDDAADAYLWGEVGKLAVRGQQATGLTFVVDESKEVPVLEDIEPLEHGWASTPTEVQAWCEASGVPYELGGKVSVVARFEGKPDVDMRAALKQAGFRWDGKGPKTWTHKAFGQYGSSTKVAARRENGPPERQAAEGGRSW